MSCGFNFEGVKIYTMHIMCRKYMKYLNINIEYLLQYLVDETNFCSRFVSLWESMNLHKCPQYSRPCPAMLAPMNHELSRICTDHCVSYKFVLSYIVQRLSSCTEYFAFATKELAANRIWMISLRSNILYWNWIICRILRTCELFVKSSANRCAKHCTLASISHGEFFNLILYHYL